MIKNLIVKHIKAGKTFEDISSFICKTLSALGTSLTLIISVAGVSLGLSAEIAAISVLFIGMIAVPGFLLTKGEVWVETKMRTLIQDEGILKLIQENGRRKILEREYFKNKRKFIIKRFGACSKEVIVLVDHKLKKEPNFLLSLEDKESANYTYLKNKLPLGKKL